MSAFTLALLALAGGGVYFLSSPDFEQFGADYIVGWIEQRTGAAVTLEAFDADFRRQRFNLEGLVLRGEEDPSDAPLMSIERVEIGLSWTGLLRRSLNLSSLSIERPQIFMTIDAGEGTNVPVPESNSSGGSSAFGLSIDDFVVANGSLTVDEQRVDVDFSLTGLEGEFGYEGTTGVLSGRIEFSGAVEREGRPLIPYALSADFDYTQGTVLVERAELESGTSSLNFQGRIDQILRTPEGQLGYTGSVELGFLNYFFVEEDLEGRMDISGDLEFSAEHFEAGGRVRSDGLTVEGWAAESLVSDFEYSFPESLLVATDLQVDVLGGGVVGEARVLSLPGPDRRVELDIAYQGIDTSALRRIYPWEGPYVVTSRAGGTLTGWFEGKFNSFDFQGSASFDPVSGTASSDTVVLPVSGSTLYRGIPGSVEVSGLVAQLGSTAVEADGLIDRDASSLDFSVESEDFRDLGFLYGGANGSGRIDGVVEGPISAPDLSGDFTVVDYNYEDWAIDRIEGRAVLTSSEVKLSGVRVIENDSEIRLNGVFDRNLGEPDLTLDIRRLTGRDLRRLVDRPVDGVVTGEIYVESIDPLRFDGLLKSTEFAYQGHSLGGIEAGVTFDPESIRISDLTLIGDGASLTGNLTYGREAAALNGRIAFSGHRLEEFGWLGVPAGITGVVRSASFRVDGSVDAPLIEGEAVFEDFQFREQRFPEAALSVEVAGQGIFVRIQAGPELSLSAEIDTSRDGYPFDGTARFLNYSADQLAGLENGSLTVTGDASFQGKLLDPAAFEGSGRVTDLTARFQKRDLRVSRPFVFDFDPDQVEVSSVELTGEATALVLEGTVAVSEQAPLDLSVRGSIDLSPVASGYEGVETGGTIIVDGQVLGDLANPELGGIATLENVSIGHEDLFLSLSSLSGDLFFDGNRVNLNDLRGSAGGGDVTLRGTVGVEGTGPGEMDIRIDAANVRVRTTEGLRTVVDGALALRGTPETPSLEGNLEVVDLSFDENFDAFLALFGDNLGGGGGGGGINKALWITWLSLCTLKGTVTSRSRMILSALMPGWIWISPALSVIPQ